MTSVNELHKCNAAAFGDDKLGEARQEKLYDLKTLVVGADNLGQMMLGNLMGLGIDNIFFFDNSKRLTSKDTGFLYNTRRFKTNKDEAIIGALHEINPTAKIRSIHGRFEESFIYDFNPDVIIDTTNDPSSKLNSLRYTQSFSGKTIPFISVSSNNYSSILAVNYSNGAGGGKRSIKVLKVKPNLEALLHEDYFGVPQGSSTSGVIAGIAAEEIRKIAFKYDDNDTLLKNSQRIMYNIYSTTRTGESDLRKVTIPRYNKKKVLVVGAGALGNWAEIYLSNMGMGQVDFLDFDVTEEKNLNRQIELRDRIGVKKAEVLSERIVRNNPHLKSHAIDGKLGEDFTENDVVKGGYDLILGCVDNKDARIAMDEIAVKHKIPYIDGGSHPKEGQVAVYIPDVTKPVSAQLDLANFPAGRVSCQDAVNPSVVMSNAITAGAMVGEIVHVFDSKLNDKPITGPLNYSTYFPNRLYVERRR